MPTPRQRPLHELLQVAGAQLDDSVPDGQLLECFLARHDEAAFATLVQRHGPMVLAVCRRILGNLADAEDAFQATFLVLVRKAASLGTRSTVGDWLHGVALRTALKARAAAAHRRHKEKAMARPEAQQDEARNDWLARLDEELHRLSARYRAVIVLCDLEGRARKESAALLGVPEGTVAGRLARARDLLARRLTQPGVVLAGESLATRLVEHTSTGLPASVVSATVKAAALVAGRQASASGVISAHVNALAEGVLKAMLLRKIRTATAVVLVLAVMALACGVLAREQALRNPDGGSKAEGKRGETPRDEKGEKGKGERRVEADDKGVPGPVVKQVRLGTTRMRHPSGIKSLALSPDGRLVASADDDGRIRLWDTGTGELRLEFPLGTGTVVVFSPDGRTLATAGGMSDGQTPFDPRELRRRPRQVFRLQGTRAHLWQAANGKHIRALPALVGPCLAFSPDGKTLAGCDDQNRVVLCETDSGRVKQRLEGVKMHQPNRPNICSIAFSPDGNAVAAGDVAVAVRMTSTVVVWEVGSGKERCRMIDPEQGRVKGLAFSPDSKLVASATPFHVCLWDAVTGKRVKDLGSNTESAVSFSTGTRLVTGGRVSVWDVNTQQCVWSLDRDIGCYQVAFSRDGKMVASTAWLNRICLWDAATGKERVFGVGHHHIVRAVAISPDGKWVATASGVDPTVRLWGPATGIQKHLLRLKGDRRHLASPEGGLALLFSPDGRTIRANGQRWDVASGRELPSLSIRSGLVAASPDGRLIASVTGPTSEQEVRIQDSATGRVLFRLARWFTESLAFSPDGRLLAVASCSGRQSGGKAVVEDTVQLWDMATGKQVRGLRPASTVPTFLAFSPDGSLLATSDRWLRGIAVQLWNVATGREVHKLSGHEGSWGTYPVAFSPDGALLATGGKDNTVILWETASGKVVRRLRGHEGAVVSLAFSPDGRWLVSGGWDTTAIVWPIVPDAGEAVKPDAWDRNTPGRLWEALARGPEVAYPAIWSLLAAPDRVVALLKGRLRPDASQDEPRLKRLVTDLGSDEFLVREKATKELASLGAHAEMALRRALAGKPDLEKRRRIVRLLEPLEDRVPAPEELRDLRSIGVLEHLATPAAEVVLEQLAQGGEFGPRTRRARAALQRLKAARQRQR
jgi:RNA polymerase sigma factor (sigma-70 family)